MPQLHERRRCRRFFSHYGGHGLQEGACSRSSVFHRSCCSECVQSSICGAQECGFAADTVGTWIGCELCHPCALKACHASGRWAQVHTRSYKHTSNFQQVSVVSVYISSMPVFYASLLLGRQPRHAGIAGHASGFTGCRPNSPAQILARSSMPGVYPFWVLEPRPVQLPSFMEML